MQIWRWLGVAAAVLGTACAAEPLRPANEKPAAPVTLRVDTVDLGSRRYEVRVSATPTADVSALDLSLLVRAGAAGEEAQASQHFGATAAGRTRVLVRHVRVDAAATGADVVADARVTSAAGTRNRAEVVRVGAPAPALAPKPATRLVLPNGDRVDEVRQ
jgi:hypothetical protein